MHFISVQIHGGVFTRCECAPLPTFFSESQSETRHFQVFDDTVARYTHTQLKQYLGQIMTMDELVVLSIDIQSKCWANEPDLCNLCGA